MTINRRKGENIVRIKLKDEKFTSIFSATRACTLTQSVLSVLTLLSVGGDKGKIHPIKETRS